MTGVTLKSATGTTVPTVTTTAASAIGTTTAAAGGNVTADGGASVTARGVAWGTSANPTIAGSHTTDGSGTGIFTSSLTGLTSNTLYHLRAYATNSIGTAYGSDLTFTTLPVVSTAAIGSITAGSASSGGSVTTGGGAAISAWGVCRSTSANPTTADTCTTDTVSGWSFTSTLTGLAASTTYHVRAYATNAGGTAYGDDIVFETKPTAALVTDFEAHRTGGGVLVQWQTSLEDGTVGFNLLGQDPASVSWVQLNPELLPALFGSPQGGRYRFLDAGAPRVDTLTYLVEEHDFRGHVLRSGPYTVQIGEKDLTGSLETMAGDAGFESQPHPLNRVPSDAKGAAQAAAHGVGAGLTAPTGRIQLAVTRDGLYHVDGASLASALGMTRQQVQTRLSHGQLALTNQGRPVAYLPDPAGDGFHFYGSAPAGYYSTENVYRLAPGAGLLMDDLNGKVPQAAVAGGVFTDSATYAEDHVSVAGLLSDPASDYFAWDYLYSASAALNEKRFGIAVDGPAGAGPATLVFKALGATNNGRRVDISLNGTPIGEATWSGIGPASFAIPFDGALLQDGENALSLRIQATGTASLAYVEGFKVSYLRVRRAAGDRLAVRGEGDQVVSVEGFGTPEAVVLELADPARPKRVTGVYWDRSADGTWRESFKARQPQTTYLLTGPTAMLAPSRVSVEPLSTLRKANNAADYLVIAPTPLLDSAAALAEYRQGQGLKTAVVDLGEIMNEFNAGNFNPQAIRTFLAFTRTHWRQSPRYVLLAGNGTYDYRNVTGQGDNLVPALLVATPFGLAGSDNQFAVFDGGHLPTMAVGRLPVHSAAEFDAVIAKIEAYEAAPAGPWASNVVLLSDNADAGGNFPADSDAVATLLPLEYTATGIALGRLPLADARSRLLAQLGGGAIWLNYLGHGGADRLAAEGLLTLGDAAGLVNAPALPVVAAMTCSVVNSVIPGYDTLGEVLVLNPGGGAIAAWGATGQAFNSTAVLLDRALIQAAFNDRMLRLGDATLAALTEYAESAQDTALLDLYNLLGDPALLIGL